QYQLARRKVFSKLKERIGFDRTEIFSTSAAPIGKDVLEFFASLDIIIREVYGQSEVTGPTSVSTEDGTHLGLLGRPMVGVEVKIADDGEILVRGDNVCMGYHKEPAATAELLRDGWLHSGDVGKLDADGYLQITGRKKEITGPCGGKEARPRRDRGLAALDPAGGECPRRGRAAQLPGGANRVGPGEGGLGRQRARLAGNGGRANPPPSLPTSPR